jgi:hypothetical protein
MRLPLYRMLTVAALAYFATVFAAGIVLGTLRTLVLAPQIGALPAVLVELPLILAIAWASAGRILARWPVAAGGPAALLMMGALSLALLLLAEAALAASVGRNFLANLATPEGMAGLAGQVVFALFPLARGR